ncbi:MAG: hypothetical protein ACO1OD_09470 [Croceibacterium sp.]
MISRLFPLAASIAVLAACERAAEQPSPVTPQTAAAVDDAGSPVSSQTVPTSSPTAAPSPEPSLVAEAFIVGEWGKAENREVCAPLAFVVTQARGAPRSALFEGGWGVAFDLPNLRSAYGVAGPGPVAVDGAPPSAQRDRLQDQWPYFMDLDALPQASFAGYGIEGAEAYPADNPAGRGLNSLAYVRVAGQACTYNVWSRLGRGHLEKLLGALRQVRVD